MSELAAAGDDTAALADLASAELTADVIGSAEDLVDDSPPKKKRGKLKQLPQVEQGTKFEEPTLKEEEPRMTDPEWSDFVMRHFNEDELDRDGRPLVHGLRRVVRLLLGPILYSGPFENGPCQAPSLVTGTDSLLQPATMNCKVTVLMCRDVPPQMKAYEATFTDVADCYFGNTDPDFVRHASATASTKAEARCMRKALQIRGIAGEERTLVPAFDAGVNGKIAPEQLNFLNALGRRNDVNVKKYVSAGKQKYGDVCDVPYVEAQKMVEHLSKMENQGTVPEGLKGYDPNWMK